MIFSKMKPEKIRIAVIAGGDSSEAEVSLRSAQCVYESLSRELYEPYIVTICAEEWSCPEGKIDRGNFSLEGVGKFDYALIMIHGTPGENGPLQGYLEMLGVPHSTSSSGVMAITFDKKLCKNALQGVEGVNLAKQVTLRRGESFCAEGSAGRIGLPLFVKPTTAGSSFGVVKVKSVDEIQGAIEVALTQGDEVMLEEFIEGVEVSQGVMATLKRDYVLPITELVTEREFFDYEAKYTTGLTQEITPARIPAETTQLLNQTTLKIYKALGCRGVVRIDYIIKDGVPYFIELNGVPGMSKQSIIPQQWARAGLTIGDGFRLIIDSTKGTSKN